MRPGLGRALSSVGKFGRNARLMLASAAVSGLTQGAYFSVWQLYLKSAGYGTTWIGTYALIGTVVATLLKLPAGLVADRFRRKWLTAISFAAAALSGAIVAYSVSEVALVVSAVIGGVGWGIGGPAWSALFAESVEDAGMDLGFSVSAFVSSAATSLGNLMGWIPEFLVRSLGLGYFEAYRWFMWLVVAIEASSILPIILVSERFRPRARGSGGLMKLGMSSKRLISAVVVTYSLIGFGAGLSIPLLGYYFSVKFGIESGPIGTLFAVTNVAAAPAFLLAAGVSARLGTVRGAAALQAASIPLLALIPLAPSFAAASALYIPRSVLMNMANPLISALVMELTPEAERGTMASISQLSWNLPNSVAQQIGGFVMDTLSLDAPLYATSGIYAIYVTAFYLMFGGLERERGSGGE
ncbi:MAG: MFS transporter [Candidatus Korarchaeota archaeon]|nr:MFS transporter [Candidatus Korarchaeota archaeon]